MNILLLRRQVGAPPPPVLLLSAAPISEPVENWWGIYYRGEKIGYATERIAPTEEGYAIQDASVMRLNLLGTQQSVETLLEMSTAPDWSLKAFDFGLRSRGVQFRARGKVLERRLRLEIDSGGYRTEKEVPLQAPLYMAAALKPFAASQNLEPGMEQIFSTFDPTTLSRQTTTLTLEGREQIVIGGKKEGALRIRQRVKGTSILSWVDGQGRILKEESPAGFTLVRESAREAKRIGEKSLPLDLIVQTAIPTEKPISDPERKSLLKLRLSGFDPLHFLINGGRQIFRDDNLEIRREDARQIRSYKIPLKERKFSAHLESTPFLQSDHPKIRALAQDILRGETDAMKAIGRLREWVYKELAKVPTVSIPNALEVLSNRKGDCNEHTVLFNALARAAGIPAKTVVGVVYLRGAFYYHAWSEVWLGEWFSLDPVLNQFPADVTHVRFLEGEIDRQIDIFQLIGRLKIQVLEAS